VAKKMHRAGQVYPQPLLATRAGSGEPPSTVSGKLRTLPGVPSRIAIFTIPNCLGKKTGLREFPVKGSFSSEYNRPVTVFLHNFTCKPIKS